MGLVLANKVIQYCSTIGTGTFELGAVAGNNRTWRSRIATGKRVRYLARRTDNAKWEIGEGILTHGTTDTISRLLIIDSSDGGTTIAWEAADGPFVIFSPQDNEIVDQLLQSNIGASRPTWAVAGTRWLDTTAGLAVSWARKLWTGTVDIEEGTLDIVRGIFVPPPYRIWESIGASNKTVAAADLGKIFTFDNAAASRTMTLPPTSGIKHGYRVGGHSLTSGGQYGVTLTPNAADKIESGANGAAVAIPGGMRFDAVWDAPGAAWRIEYYGVYTALTWTGRRQTVATGPISAGLPSGLPGTNASLAITWTIATQFIVAAAGGFDFKGVAVDRIGVTSSNLAWTGLTASRAAATPNYLYVDVAADGSLTTGSTTVAPIYQQSGTPAVTSGQFTFNIGEMKGYLGNGSSAPQAYRVYVGEAATDGTGVISTVMYAYNGRYESAFTATLPGTATYTSRSHNLGIKPRIAKFVIENTTAQSPFVVGEQVTEGHITVHSTSYSPLPIITTEKTIAVRSGVSQAHCLMDNAGVVVTLTAASWKYGFTADRGW